VGFYDAVKLGFSNYVNFEGRACRSEYWYWFLFAIIGWTVTAIIDTAIGVPITSWIFSLAIFFPWLSVIVRRLHDLDCSGWWILLPLIPPLVGWILPGAQIPLVGGKLFFIPLLRDIVLTIGLLGLILFIIFMCSPGTDGPNRFH
jgi:uncharacterized membrane protein YhaH (DUF805 family)